MNTAVQPAPMASSPGTTDWAAARGNGLDETDQGSGPAITLVGDAGDALAGIGLVRANWGAETNQVIDFESVDAAGNENGDAADGETVGNGFDTIPLY